MFTISHAFKSKSNSSKRTQECARLLNEEMQVVFKNIKKVALHLLIRKKNFYSPLEIKNLLMKKFPFVSESPGFYLCPMIPSISMKSNTFSFKSTFKDRVIWFSAKESINNETEFLMQQMDEKYLMIDLRSNPHISFLDTKSGGISYSGTKFKFILLPREQSISYERLESFLIGLNEMKMNKSSLASNRGSKHKVLFEDSYSNYVDLGIGVSRFMPGIYKKKIHGVSDLHIENVNKYFKFVQECVTKHLPLCLLKRFNEVLNIVGLEDFDTVEVYAEKKKLRGTCVESINKCFKHSFMPSASFGSNNLLPLHTDQDMFLSIVQVHALSDVSSQNGSSSYDMSCKVAKYFTFDDGESVALRSGDILVFNPTIPHCVSSTTNEYQNDKVFCISHYFKSLIAGRNNNLIEFVSKES